jgi:hypothetical protein
MPDSIRIKEGRYTMDNNLDLKKIGEKYGTDKFVDTVNYIEPYLQYFEKIRNLDLKILEIGVAEGSGLLTWNEYFKNSKIFGMDNWRKHSKYSTETQLKCKAKGIQIFSGDQSSRGHLLKMIERFGNFNIIIDDGGHTMSQQQISLGFLFKFVEPGGIYVIEDLITSYDEYGEWRSDFYKDYPKNCQEIDKISTLEFLKKIELGNYEKGAFIKEDEFQYLKNNIASCEVFENLGDYQNGYKTAMAVIIKK